MMARNRAHTSLATGRLASNLPAETQNPGRGINRASLNDLTYPHRNSDEKPTGVTSSGERSGLISAKLALQTAVTTFGCVIAVATKIIPPAWAAIGWGVAMGIWVGAEILNRIKAGQQRSVEQLPDVVIGSLERVIRSNVADGGRAPFPILKENFLAAGDDLVSSFRRELSEVRHGFSGDTWRQSVASRELQEALKPKILALAKECADNGNVLGLDLLQEIGGSLSILGERNLTGFIEKLQAYRIGAYAVLVKSYLRDIEMGVHAILSQGNLTRFYDIPPTTIVGVLNQPDSSLTDQERLIVRFLIDTRDLLTISSLRGEPVPHPGISQLIVSGLLRPLAAPDNTSARPLEPLARRVLSELFSVGLDLGIPRSSSGLPLADSVRAVYRSAVRLAIPIETATRHRPNFPVQEEQANFSALPAEVRDDCLEEMRLLRPTDWSHSPEHQTALAEGRLPSILDRTELAMAISLRPPHGWPQGVHIPEEWRSETVRALAAAIYADRGTDRMSVLADALEEAGCDHVEILSRCRSYAMSRNAWIIREILGTNTTPPTHHEPTTPTE